MVPRRRLRRASRAALLLAYVIAGSGAVYAAGGHGTGSHRASHTANWRVLNTAAVGPRPGAAVADGRTRRAFVASRDSVSGLDRAAGGALRTLPRGVGRPDFG